ncbi:MAG: branched-chain amino acid transport system permease protein [Gaiellaceae bacterium]|nr:branched-chain amino acid transport system permease protein [Gaiellaceae bacterium]
MTQFLQATVNGLLQGGLLALVAVGFSLVWGVMNIVNLAHGAIVLIGAYSGWKLDSSAGIHPLVGMVVAGVALLAAGYVIQRYLINLVVNAPIWMTLLLTFGLSLLLVNGLVLLFTGDFRSIDTTYGSDSLELGDVRVPYGRLIAFAIAIAFTVGLVWFMDRTRLGLAIKATGMDRGAARLMGVKVRRVYGITFGIAAGLAGAAGAISGTVDTFSPSDAGGFTLQSFVIAVLGGLGNMWGALVGGLMLGVVQAWSGQYLGGTLINAVAFAVLVIVLVVRPEGLLGKPYYAQRVEV